MMKTIVQLENKEVRAIIARFLGIPLESVIPNRYNFSIVGMTAVEIKERVMKKD
jgi:lambda repressor-like predicted transcriptional regulator